MISRVKNAKDTFADTIYDLVLAHSVFQYFESETLLKLFAVTCFKSPQKRWLYSMCLIAYCKKSQSVTVLSLKQVIEQRMNFCIYITKNSIRTICNRRRC